MELIDKAAVVAEIKRRIRCLKSCHADRVAGYAGEISGLERLLSFLDALEVKEIKEPIDAFIEKADEFISMFFHPDDTELIDTVLNRFHEHMKLK